MNSTIRVFFGSPGDLEEERNLASALVKELSESTIHEFEFLGFEVVLGITGQRPQSVINKLIDECDVFLAVFHRRWGQITSDTVVHSSYTEEEFERARRRYEKTGSPEMFCFFKQLDLPSLADPGEQLAKVLEFRQRLEASHQVLYRTFTTANHFITDLKQHLVAFADGNLPSLRTSGSRIHLPIITDHLPESKAIYDIAKVRLAQDAMTSGRIEEATVLMANVSQTTRNIEMLEAIREFFHAVKNSDAAQAVQEKIITLLYDRRLAAYEYVSVFMTEQWLDQMIVAMLNNLPAESHSNAEKSIRKLFTGTRFRELMIESMAKHFTVGELLTLARFYSGEGASIMTKFGHYMGCVIPEINSIIAAENPELFCRGF